jgi:hypothetical protein
VILSKDEGHSPSTSIPTTPTDWRKSRRPDVAQQSALDARLELNQQQEPAQQFRTALPSGLFTTELDGILGSSRVRRSHFTYTPTDTSQASLLRFISLSRPNPIRFKVSQHRCQTMHSEISASVTIAALSFFTSYSRADDYLPITDKAIVDYLAIPTVLQKGSAPPPGGQLKTVSEVTLPSEAINAEINSDPSLKDKLSVVTNYGFRDVDEWLACGDRLLSAYLIVIRAEQASEFDQQLKQAEEQLKSDMQLTAKE